MFNIRKAIYQDISVLVELERQCFQFYVLEEDHFKKFMRSNNAEIIIIENEAKVCGYLLQIFRKNSTKARIYSFAIDQNFRNQKLGTQLLLTAEKSAKERGLNGLSLEVMIENLNGVAFYRKHGFIEKEITPHYYTTGVHALKMHKAI